MRIVEPKPTRGVPAGKRSTLSAGKRNKRSNHKALWLSVGFGLVLVLAGGAGFWFNRSRPHASPAPTTSASAKLADLPLEDVKAPATSPEAKPIQDGFRVFTSDEFRVLYSNYDFIGTAPIVTAPPITGNVAADTLLQNLAEARGYQLRRLVDGPLVTVDDLALQQPAANAWTELKTAAANDGIQLIMTSGFRSPEDQKSLFMGRLSGSGATPESLAQGESIAAANQTLEVTAPPGYSRHHTGYVVDIACGNDPGLEFVDSQCYAWLSADNYLHAKQSGWIPSYPHDVVFQGPEPEAWEYVWVGKEVLQ